MAKKSGRLKGRQETGPSHGGRRASLEQLESRQMLSVTPPSIELVDSQVVITGSGIEDEVVVSQPTPESVHVRVRTVTDYIETTFAASQVQSVFFAGGEGDDNLLNSTSIRTFADGGQGNDILQGGPGPDTLSGGAGNDSLIGNGGADLLQGDDGDDTIYGNAGADTLRGGAGNDRLLGGDDNDTLSGDEGDDYLAGQGGTNTSFGDAGADTLIAGDNGDRLFGGDDADNIVGGQGPDYIEGGGGNDELSGNGGSDELLGGLGDDELRGGDGNDQLYGGDGNDTLSGQAGDDILAGEAGADILQGGDGADSLRGGDGNDSLLGGSGNDDLAGQEGVDTIYGDAGDDALDGGAGEDDLQGGDGVDTLFGGSENDRLAGQAGNDLLYGEGGNDVLLGGLGDDRLVGGLGGDSLLGGDGNDTLFGQAGDDLLLGEAGLDNLDGGDGIDELDGGSEDDTLLGGDGNDTLNGDAGNDSLFGQAGNDTLIGSTGDDRLIGGQGNDLLAAGDGNDYLSGQEGADNLDGQGGSDELLGGLGDDELRGGDGNDQLYGGDGNDTLSGQAGDDILAGEAGADILQGGDGADSLRGGDGNDSLLGGSGNDDLAGQEGVDTIYGDAGDDALDGGAGEDDLQGGDGVDTLFGGSENDRLAGQAGNDLLYGEGGNDVLLGGLGDDRLVGGLGGDSLLGGDGNDTLFGQAGDDLLLGEAGLDNLDGGDGIDELDGGSEDDTLLGGSENDRLTGGLGNDTLFGQSGDDVLLGGEGDDFIVGGEGGDVLLGEAGADQLDGGLGADTLRGGAENDILQGGADRDTLVGEGGDDQLFGGDADDKLTGSDGNDTLEGGAGSDTLAGDAGDDNLDGGDGNDFLTGAAGDDVLIGGNGNDELRGNEGNDALSGNAGRDLLVGSTGNDVLIGGSGIDTLDGSDGEDILNGGITTHDADIAALRQILAAWTTPVSYEARVDALEQGLGVPMLMSEQSVFDDLITDSVFGGVGRDWFFLPGFTGIWDPLGSHGGHSGHGHGHGQEHGHGHEHGSLPVLPTPPPVEGFDLIDSLDNLIDTRADEAVHSLLPHANDPVRGPEHLRLFELVRYDQVTHYAVQDGTWSDPATWHGGAVPQNGSRVLIPIHTTITVDGVLTEAPATVRVDGTLRFDHTVDTQLKVDTVVVSPVGRFEMGTAENRIAPNVTATLLITDNGPIDRDWDPFGISRGLITHGSVSIYGTEKTTSVEIFNPLPAGTTQLQLSETPTGWRVGDQIVIAGTVAGQQQDEVRTILSIGSNIVTVAPLDYDHLTPAADLRVHVANLTRNAVIDSEGSAPDRRGHVMFMHNRDVDVQHAGFYKQGRSNKLEYVNDAVVDSNWNLAPGTGTNTRGRYSVHFHRNGLVDDGNPSTVYGSAVVDSVGWGFVNHSSYVDFTDNVSYGVTGAAFVSEAGDEIGIFRDNISFATTGTDERADDREPLQDFGFGGDGFWFQGAGIEVVDNIAVGSQGSGFFYYTRGLIQSGRLTLFDASNLPDPSIAGGQEQILVDHVPARNFEGNTAYGSETGLTVRYHLRDATHSTFSSFRNSTFWNNKTGVDLPYSQQVALSNLRVLHDDSILNQTGVNSNSVTQGVVYDNLTVEGYAWGIVVAPRGLSIVSGGTFAASRAIVVDPATAPNRSLLVIGNPQFSGVDPKFTGNVLPADVMMRFTTIPHNGSTNHLFFDTAVTLNYGPYDDRRLYWLEQDPSAVPFPVAGAYIRPEYVGLTSQQLWDQFRIAIGGSLAPPTAVEAPSLVGLLGG